MLRSTTWLKIHEVYDAAISVSGTILLWPYIVQGRHYGFYVLHTPPPEPQSRFRRRSIIHSPSPLRKSAHDDDTPLRIGAPPSLAFFDTLWLTCV